MASSDNHIGSPRSEAEFSDGSPPSVDQQPVGTTPQASISYNQHAEMEHRAKGRENLDRQIWVSKSLNFITAGAAMVALIGLLILYATLSDARKATVLANRAWIVPIGLVVSGQIAGDKDLGLQVLYNNLGRGPALRVAAAVDGISVPVKKKTDIEPVVGGPNNTCDRARVLLKVATQYSLIPLKIFGAILYFRAAILILS